ncbi:MAG: EAL domain-containing protein [Methylophaga sp.]|nr:EAL domain-containing protein [Methylophaga sp.]
MSYLNLSPKQKITITALLYVFWVVSFTTYSVIQEKKELYKVLDRQLEDAALLTPLLLPRAHHNQGMHKQDLSKEQDYRNLLSLSDFTDNSEVIYIYTLILRDNKVLFTSSSATEEERESGEGLTFYFDHYDDVAPRVYDIFNTKEKAFLEYTDQWGAFRSIFIPSHSTDGTFYITVADLSISHIQALLNQQVYRSLTIAILFLLFIYPIYWAATFSLKNITKELDKKVQEQTEELFQKEKRLNHALVSAKQSWFDVDLVTGKLNVSDGLPKLLKYNPATLKINFLTWKKNIHPDDKARVLTFLNECLKTGGPTEVEYRLHAFDNSWPWVHSVGEIIEWDDDGNPIRMMGIHRDITERKLQDKIDKEHDDQLISNQRALLELSKDKFTSLNETFNKLVLTDAEQLKISRVSIWLLGGDNSIIRCGALYNQGEISNSGDVLTATDYPNYFNLLNTIGFISADDAQTNSGTNEFTEQYLKPLGITSMLDTPIRINGELIGIVCHEHIGPKRIWTRSEEEFGRSISDLCAQAILEDNRFKADEKLSLIAHYDVLTQLPNRTLFADRFSQAVAHSKRTNSMLAICFLDLDNFKPINDNYGHDVGDQLLIKVANRIKATIREEDTASRQGGDEFTLLLRDIESFEQCEQLLKRIRDALAQPYIINDSPLKITGSIGVTIYPLDDADLDTLVRHADQAMYQAKLAGKNQQQVFNALGDREIADRQSQLSEIKQALTSKQFQLYYQPKVNMKTGNVFGAEALIRWIHPEKGLIPPLDFLPIIEGTELEIQIGGWVIHEALSQMDSWQKQDIDLEVSINISSHHLQSAVFFDQINEALDNHPDVNSQDLQLEILESSALGDINAINGIIKSCQNVLGVNVALDDFGTGYSSLTHMKNLSANTIKIDQTFVRDLLDDPNDYSIIEGIIGLAKAFNREVIAEGVETNAHGLMLLIMGCNEAQGYGISRPIPADDLVTWLADYKPNSCWTDYGNRSFTPQEHKILLLQLTTEHWFNNINKVLLTMDDSGFGQFFMKCHLGVWLSRFEDEGLFKQDWQEQLKQAHDVMFNLASELIDQHQAGRVDEAQARIGEFELSYKAVFSLLNDYNQHAVAKISFAALGKKKPL